MAAGIELPLAPERLAMEEYHLQQVVLRERRPDRLDAVIAELAAAPEWAPPVSRIGAVRGVGTVTTFSVSAEIGDFSRFPAVPAFMSYLGLAPSEDSTGQGSRRPITRTGNEHARTLLVETAWHYACCRSPLSPNEIAGPA